MEIGSWERTQSGYNTPSDTKHTKHTRRKERSGCGRSVRATLLWVQGCVRACAALRLRGCTCSAPRACAQLSRSTLAGRAWAWACDTLILVDNFIFQWLHLFFFASFFFYLNQWNRQKYYSSHHVLTLSQRNIISVAMLILHFMRFSLYKPKVKSYL